jgi:hypothetical protein
MKEGSSVEFKEEVLSFLDDLVDVGSQAPGVPFSTGIDGNDNCNKIIKVLDRTGVTVGHLYDARSDVIINACIISTEMPPEYINTRPLMGSDRVHESVHKISSSYDLLKLDVSLKISIVTGIYTVAGGAGKCLKHYKEERDVETLLIWYSERTSEERLNFSAENVQQYYNINLIGSTTATHYISSVVYGGNLVVEASKIKINEKRTNEKGASAELGGGAQVSLSLKAQYDAAKGTSSELEYSILNRHEDGGIFSSNTDSGFQKGGTVTKDLSKAVAVEFTITPISTIRRWLFEQNKFPPDVPVNAISYTRSDETCAHDIFSLIESFTVLAQNVEAFKEKVISDAVEADHIPDKMIQSFNLLNVELQWEYNSMKVVLQEQVKRVRSCIITVSVLMRSRLRKDN